MLNDIQLTPPLNSFKLNNFIICDNEYLKNVYPSLGKNGFNDDYKYLIYETNENIKSKSFENKFTNIINDFINIFLYFNAKKIYSKSVYGSFFKRHQNEELHFSYTDISFSSKIESYSIKNHKYKIDEKIFKAKGNNKKLFNYIENEPPTEIERKIKLAVSWIGQSLEKANLDEAYMELCIALETLLSGYNSPMERGTAYQLREYGAFLATKNKNKRVSIYNDLKILYNIRCTISHSGIAKKLTTKEYYRLLKILKAIINELFILLETKNITTHKKLQDYIDEIKFENK
ncbi:MAG: hypothetical protein WCY19_00635 [Candidatus Gastranaerophilaceae bacterium]